MFAKVFLVPLLASLAYAGYSNHDDIANSNILPYRPYGYRYPYAGYNNYGGATSHANSNLQSYGGYGYGKFGRYNIVGYYDNDKYSYPRYSFNYGVNDPITGDQKEQQEVRDGDSVRGHYALKEADGTTRSVEYQANDRDGFNAVVSRYGVAHHPVAYNYNYKKY